jgi:tRNA (adenine57-N1/adenine58-N1)-methyltransferase catalytic subunit
MKILMTSTGRKFFYKGQDLHTEYGFIKKEDIEAGKPGKKLLTNKNVEMTLLEPSFIDVYRRIKRMPQIIPLKDIGPIIAETGINRKSVVLDSGAGSGGTVCFLANIVKKVYTYDIRDDFLEVVKHNIEFLGLKNVKVKHQDVCKKISEKNLDLVLLDLPTPWEAIENAAKALKPGGFLISYSPTVPQVSDFVEAVKKNKSFVYLKTTETLERDWEFEERKIRPKSQQIGHSGFLSFCRRV